MLLIDNASVTVTKTTLQKVANQLAQLMKITSTMIKNTIFTRVVTITICFLIFISVNNNEILNLQYYVFYFQTF